VDRWGTLSSEVGFIERSLQHGLKTNGGNRRAGAKIRFKPCSHPYVN
jgi:hypothetical protein